MALQPAPFSIKTAKVNQRSVDIIIVTKNLAANQAPALYVEISGAVTRKIPLTPGNGDHWFGAMSAAPGTRLIFSAICLIQDGGGMDVLILSPRKKPRAATGVVIGNQCETGPILYRTAP